MSDTDTMVGERQQNRQDVRRNEGQTPARQEQRQPQQQRGREQPTMIPRVDVVEDQKGITLFADLPGVPREALEIHIEGDSLTIEGHVEATAPQAMEASYAEVRIPHYRRTFTLSRELDGSRVEAQLKDGVLRLWIPKQEHAQPRRITVSAG